MVKQEVLLVADYNMWNGLIVSKSQAIQLFVFGQKVQRMSKILKVWNFEAETVEQLAEKSQSLKTTAKETEVMPVLKESGIPEPALRKADAVYHVLFLVGKQVEILEEAEKEVRQSENQ